MGNFERNDRADLIRRGMLARCNSTGREFSVGPVEVVARYSDCSVFICPECRGQHDDRMAWGGPSQRRMGYTVVMASPDLDVGSRVQIPAWSDRWMRGDRYGVVITRPHLGGRPVMVGTWFVRLDKSGRIVGFGSDAITVVSDV